MTDNEELKRQILEYGDYQTPEDFVDKVCKYVNEELKIEPTVVLEPTFGLGNFLAESIKLFSSIKKAYGVEINEKYYNYAKDRINEINTNADVTLFNESIFTFDFNKIKDSISKDDNVLVIGNPPWVTNSDLTSINSENLPLKENFKGLTGLDAITGKGNFDIAEYIMLQLLDEFKHYNCHVAMLCKTIVARNIVRDLEKYDFDLCEIKMLTFNALEVFDVNCEACLLIMKLGGEKRLICDVYDFENPSEKVRSFGWVGEAFISDIENYTNSIDGNCQYEWRQGIKHDCSKVMELSPKQKDGTYINGFKQNINVEDTYIYPVLKSSDIKKYVINKEDARKSVIVTQKKVGDETDSIEQNSPMLWDYLQTNGEYLDNRKSSIYKKAPRFAIFGVGDYSYKPYKVVISGFYKNPVFGLAYNSEDINKVIMLDDTCYFLGFEDYKSAVITTILLNSDLVQNFLKSIAFMDSKRPYTKDILMRIDLIKVVNSINFEELLHIANTLSIEHNLTIEDYEEYVSQLASN